MALGGAIGSAARYWLTEAAAPWSRVLPWGTIGVNVLGSFVIGFFGALTVSGGRLPAAAEARLFVMTGLCGGFTTFSAFSAQTMELLRAGAIGRAALNVLYSVLLCVLAAACGAWMAGLKAGS